MVKASRDFQVFAKPIGPVCNLRCDYCYYLEKKDLYSQQESWRMPDDVLERYIIQHIDASPGPIVRFSWHGGEPTVPGLDYFRRIVSLQRRHRPSGFRMVNGLQTNGTLIDEDWARFLAEEGFAVGLSLDGPPEMHDSCRLDPSGAGTHQRALRGYHLLRRHGVHCDILCVIHARNVGHPLEVYRFFKQIDASHISFLPLVQADPRTATGVSPLTPPAEAVGKFLVAVFEEWKRRDIGRIKIQLFEETAGTALGREPALCLMRPTCGDIPVVEHNGDFYCCDHFVDPGHCLGNILDVSLIELLESPAQKAFGLAKRDGLPPCCLECEVLSLCRGGCPKDRFLPVQGSENHLNYLCPAYKRFFNHCRPFLDELAALGRGGSGQLPRPPQQGVRTPPKIGRNDPCPCGSGLKYKKCCLNK